MRFNNNIILCFYCISGNKPSSPLLLAFSVLYNGNKIFTILPVQNIKTDSISSIHGLRAISILWVVLCHRFMMFGTVPAVVNLNAAFGVSINFLFL